MQRPIALTLTAILIMAGGAFLIFNDKSANTNWPADNGKVATSSSALSSSGGGGSGSVSVESDLLPAKTTQPSTDTSASSSDKATQGDSNSKQTIVGTNTSVGNQEPEKRTTPVKAAPVNNSPSPQPSKQVPSGTLLLTESLQYMNDGRKLLAGPKNDRTYPVIKLGTSYSGTVGSSGSLSQSDISRLIAYPSPAIVNVPPPATHKEGHNDASGKTIWTEMPYNPIPKPIGSYSSDALFKKTIDDYIANMGPHIQRKLHTSEWVFTPAPSASYLLDWSTPTFGAYQIRGMLKVRYNDANNTLGLEPNVWYQGDVEMGWTRAGFFSNDEPRDVLVGLVILGNWGE